MRETKIFIGTLKECRDQITKIEKAMGIPDSRTGTLKYAIPRPHGKTAGMSWFPVKEGIFSRKHGREMKIVDYDKVATLTEKSRRKSLAAAKLEGTFNSSKTI